MKRNAFDVIRRGFDNALANWQLILLRIAEGMVFAGLVIAAVFAAVIPILVSAGLGDYDLRNPENVGQFLISLIIDHWMVIVYLFGLVFILFGVLIAVHSFVEAACARIYVDGERAPAMRAFDLGRWFRGGADGWWPVFWIYNLAWSVACLVLLVPLTITIAALLLVTENTGRIVIGCSGIGFTLLLGIPIGIVVGIWVRKAIAVCVGRALGAVEALRVARRDVRLDFGRHLAVGIVMMIIGIMAGAVVSGVSFPFSWGNHNVRGSLNLLPLFFAPMQIVMTAVQSVISSAVSGWTLASFVALAEER